MIEDIDHQKERSIGVSLVNVMFWRFRYEKNTQRAILAKSPKLWLQVYLISNYFSRTQDTITTSSKNIRNRFPYFKTLGL